MKRFLAPTLGALAAAGALSIAPAQAAEPDGQQTEVVVLFGDGSDGQGLGTEPEATRVSLVGPDANQSGNYPAYENGTAPSGQIAAEMPVDPAWFNPSSAIEFSAPSNGGDPGYATEANVLLRFGEGWAFGSAGGDPLEYGRMNDASDTRYISSDGGDLDVYTTLCDGGPWTQPGGVTERGGWSCSAGDVNIQPETQIVASTSPSPSPGDNGDGASASGGGSGEYIQQFAKSSSMTCDEAQPEGLNWSGAPSGGWGESWAQWPNDGRGGEVCVRTLFYNTSTGKWDVR